MNAIGVPRTGIIWAVVVAVAYFLASPPPVSTQSATVAPFDAAQFKTIPVGVVIGDIASEYNWLLVIREVADRHTYRDAYLAALATIDPDIRRLVLLDFLRSHSGGGEEEEGLHTFFFLDSGDVAPEVGEALREAGFERQYRTFSEAIALFGPNYPLDRSVREKNFAWSQPGTRIDDVTTIPQPLNAFDHKILALSEQFGTRRQFADAIGAYVHASPFLTERVDRARERLSARKRLDWLTGKLQSRIDLSQPPADVSRALDALPKPYRTLAVLSIFWDQYYNGGVEQFISNPSGTIAPGVVDALRDLGLARDADSLEKGLRAFPTPYPVDTRQRGDFLSRHADIDAALEQITVDMHAVDNGTMLKAMIELAESEGVLPR
jgi:Domain of unknown function (DUF4375)